MKCREYKAYSVLCQDCDIKVHIACSKKFNFDKKEKYISVQRRDFVNVTWN
ncbi:hypothetical protein G8S21_01360 [Clostridium botulinum C]|uniref:hypothetical protein n=1 Tax=Clostridium botulinum TaxID=1491 RepID=UPI001E38175A|nr:hypothetical protein [Clostridium botulinum]MCD3244594.1 hypothetical protein [Clostridium botulinum C]MCD3261153.1 hypothetical protein [Clostridium botulinum C]